jgi:hypothetical protein
MIKLDLNKKDIIFLFDEKYEVVEIIKESRTINEKPLKFYTYKLEPKSEDILHADISIYDKDNIFLKTTKIVDCDIKARAVQWDGKIYQIFKEYQDVEYDPRADKVKRVKVYELHDIRDRIINFDNPRQIVVHKNGDKVLHDFQKLKINDIRRTENVKGEIERPEETRKFKIKYKEPVG